MTNNVKYKIMVELIVEFSPLEIELDGHIRLAEQYANMATNYASIGAESSRVVSMEEI
jgi:hypothetical protein